MGYLKKLCKMRSFFHFSLILFLWISNKPLYCEILDSNDPAEKLIQEAIAKKLFLDPWWFKLLHYHRHFGVMKSDIDGGYFFLSRNGKNDSRAEMEATIRALLSANDLSPPLEKGLEPAAMHPLCKFRARLRFLQSHLNFPDSLLPDIDCSRYQTWHDALKPEGVTLIFASSYLNNPASMFGHTFLRLNTYSGKSDKSLLNYGITYAANVPPSDNFSFAFKGIFGMYRGTYGIVPYFVSLQKYSHLESRDIWEYDLKIDSLQTECLVEHIWEVGACWMEYYFFDENCSSNMFTLLDVAFPKESLSESLDPTAIVPSETVKALKLNTNLVKDIRWRPSLLTSVRLKTSAMGLLEKKWLVNYLFSDSIAIKVIPPFSKDTVSAILDIALDYVQYQKRHENKSEQENNWNRRQGELLRLRSNYPTESYSYPQKPDDKVTSPEEGHGAHLLQLSSGIYNYKPFLDFGFRFAYHDFNAPEAGFLKGSQIEAFKISLRTNCPFGCENEKLNIEILSADLLNILSISPGTFLHTPLSWAARIGYENRMQGMINDGKWFTVEGGGGLAFDYGTSINSMIYGLLEGKIRGPKLDHVDANIGPQTKFGIKIGFGKNISILAENRLFLPLDRKPKIEKDISMEGRVSLKRNLDFRVKLGSYDDVGEGSLAWNIYF